MGDGKRGATRRFPPTDEIIRFEMLRRLGKLSAHASSPPPTLNIECPGYISTGDASTWGPTRLRI